ncbi:hypothetical protein OF83DRAFT_1172824 [Amylostereum chailletii]|nr:hypothetical protein OF83DRAFT_1172824 [Amylostereum chailletii]
MANTSFQLVLNDTSPTLSFFPISDTLGLPNLFAGWNPAFSLSGFASTQGELGNGTSSHVTALDSAAFSVQWFGSAIQLFGNLSGPASYDLSLDGQSNSSISSFDPSNPTLLASYDQLPQQDHVLSLTFHNPTNTSSALIAIDRAVFTTSASSNASITESRVDDTEIAFVGEWTFLEDTTLTPDDAAFHTTTHRGDSFSYNFTGSFPLYVHFSSPTFLLLYHSLTYTFTGSAVVIAGFRDAPSGRYIVRLDGDTYFFDGRSSFREAATLFVQAGLAANVTHNMTVTNNEDRLLAIGYINVTRVDDPAASATLAHARGNSNIPAAAIAVASILGFIVALLIAFYIWRRRRRVIAHRRRTSPAGSTHTNVLDIGPEDGGMPAYKQEDKGKSLAREGSANSISFTLDLPIQTRPSRTPTHSGNSVQEIPRSPTVSQMPTREGTHASAGQELAPPHPYIDLPINSPFEVQFLQPLRTGGSSSLSSFGRSAPIQAIPQDLSQSSSGLGDARPSSPLLPLPTPPRLHVTPGTPENRGEGAEAEYSFLDIAPSTGEGTSSSSSRRRLSEQTATTASHHRPISLGYAFGYHHHTDFGALAQASFLVRSLSQSSASRYAPTSPGLTEPPSAISPSFPQEPPSPTFLVQQPPPIATSPTSPRILASPIRPLPRIPLSPPAPMSASSIFFPRTPPALQLQTHFESQLEAPAPPSGRALMSATTTGLTSAFGSNTDDGSRLLQPPAGKRRSSAVSPTDSIPLTVSDIHFRHSSDEEDRTAALEAAVATSPGAGPSSGTPTGRTERRGYASPFIMQKLLGGRPTLRSPESPLQPGDRGQLAQDEMGDPTFAPGLERPDKPARKR